MPITLEGNKYYRTMEVCKKVGISRSTLFRWFSEGVFNEPQNRDRRGWRLYSEKEVEIMGATANHVSVNYKGKQDY
jgi:predicted site-specific integrase-resolvase